LYGFKQTPKEQYEKIDNVILSNEFKINKKMYLYKKNIDKGYVTVYLCIDGMFILDSNNYMIKSIKKILIYKFDLINFFRTFESLDYKLSCYLNCYHAFNNQFF
jgi:hypothetical protein